MTDKRFLKRSLLAMLLFAFSVCGRAQQWSVAKANEWGNQNPWFCGVNYIPANALNYTAMWDKTSFSPQVMKKELALMKEAGMNCARFVMQYAVYEQNPKRFIKVLDKVLDIMDEAGVKAMPIFFDDCCFGTGTDPVTGDQGEPMEGWYAWKWSPSPGLTMVVDERTHGKLEKYVKDIMAHFRDDSRIMVWDLYNEPTNSSLPNHSWPLLKKVFAWAREIQPTQPITSGIWNGNNDLNKFLAENSDIITFHLYGNAKATEQRIRDMKVYNRPVICTEWMNRPMGSTIKDCLRLFADSGTGCMMWGLVNGKTQTNLPWGHRPENLPYTGPWQHDIYHGDFTPYDPEEIELLKKVIAEKNGLR